MDGFETAVHYSPLVGILPYSNLIYLRAVSKSILPACVYSSMNGASVSLNEFISIIQFKIILSRCKGNACIEDSPRHKITTSVIDYAECS